MNGYKKLNFCLDNGVHIKVQSMLLNGSVIVNYLVRLNKFPFMAVFLFCLAIAPIPAEGGAENSNVSRDQRITYAAKDQPLGEILKAISLITGYKFKISSQWEKIVTTVTFLDVTLEEGLARILKNAVVTNSALIVDENNRVITIYTASDGGPETVAPSATKSLTGTREDQAPVLPGPGPVAAKSGEPPIDTVPKEARFFPPPYPGGPQASQPVVDPLPTLTSPPPGVPMFPVVQLDRSDKLTQ